ncbi:synaptonemal complex central element protein 2 [Engraulis encrasicolus]|uniref:synaptonemal complex central element protein 2 n=1 Tax=Engraulis encrasicolus TaxID=184585 RepID=UPI002FD717DA
MDLDQHSFEKPSSPLCQSTPKSDNPRHRPAFMDSDAMVEDDSEQTMPFLTLDDTEGSKSEDSGMGTSTLTNGSLPASDTEDNSSCSFPLNQKVDTIGRKAQDLIERINHSRAIDQKLMVEFEETLMNKVSEICEGLKNHMFSQYEEQSSRMEAQLQQLSEVLGRSSQLCVDLQGASQTLAVINRGLQHNSEQE